MTPVAFNRITQSLVSRTGKLDMRLHSAAFPALPVDSWSWLNDTANHSTGQLDSIIVAHSGGRIYYIHVDDVTSLSVSSPTSREVLKKPADRERRAP